MEAMEGVVWCWSLCACFVVTLILSSFRSSLLKRGRLPPGPFPLPFVGNLLHVHGMPHRCFADLAKTHGPLMTLQLGCRTTIVISSAEVAREALVKNDLALSGRSVPDCLRFERLHELSVVWISSTQLWRDLRRFYSTELFAPQKLDANGPFRLRKVRELLEFVGRCCDSGAAVDIGRATYTATFNLVTNVVFSTDLFGFDSDSSLQLKDLVWKISEVAGKPNITDFFPVLRFIDPQGLRRRQKKQLQQLQDVLDKIIEERQRSMMGGGTTYTDVLDAFLRSKFDQQTIRSGLTDIFVAGSETSAATVEWAMAELLRNPEVMRRSRTELANTMPPEKEVEESDIPRLPYLQAIVKETLRLHPPAPLLLPHKAERNVALCGYTVPTHSQVLVNVWAIGRDPSRWSDSESFRPERFMQGDQQVDFRGRDFELIPFGSGRRICPGLPLANRIVHLMLASLLRSYDWKLPNGMTPTDLDMTEEVGVTMRLATPLMAVPTKR